jgi:hypothetical protein
MKTFKQMENAFYKAVRQELLDGLALCTSQNHRMFKMMYARDTSKNPDWHEDWTIEKTVNHLPRGRLARALEQVQATLDKQS